MKRWIPVLAITALLSLPVAASAAVGAFTINLYRDANGEPGSLITDDSVKVGERFFIEIMARELHPGRGGFAAVSLDISWNPRVLQEIDDPFDPHKLITSNLPVAQRGTLDNRKGEIDNITGLAVLSSNLGRAIGNTYPERFCVLRFQAIGTSTSPITMRQGRSRIATVPVSSLGDANLYYEPQVITVLAANANVPADSANSKTRIPEDINSDGVVTPLDALLLINRLNGVTAALQTTGDNVYDVNRDGQVSSRDALQIINYLNRNVLSTVQGEGEGQTTFLETTVPVNSQITFAQPQPCPAQYLTSASSCDTVTVNRPGLSAATYSVLLEDSMTETLLQAPADGWDIYDNVPVGASISKARSEEIAALSVRLQGNGVQNGYRLRNANGSNWSEPTRRKLEWMMKFRENFSLLVSVETSAGPRLVQYTPNLSSYRRRYYDPTLKTWVVQLGLGAESRAGKWIALSRDLQADLKALEPNTTITNVNSIQVYGSGELAKIHMVG